MSSPYREMFIETAPVRLGAGRCPWCHAAVRFNANERLAVCGACDATFATSIASAIEPPAPVRDRRAVGAPQRPGDGDDAMPAAGPDDEHVEPVIEPVIPCDVITRCLVAVVLVALQLTLATMWLFVVKR